METPGIPELNQSTIEEKKDSEMDKNMLSRQDVHHHLHLGTFEKVLLGGLLLYVMIYLYVDHIFGHNWGSYGQTATPPVETHMRNQ